MPRHACGKRTSRAGSRSCSVRRARGSGRSCAGPATRPSRCRSPGRSSHSTSASPPACSSTRRKGSETVADPTLYLFDGYNLPHADARLERLAAEFRDSERVCLVSSDFAVRGTSGQEVAKISSAAFVAELAPTDQSEERPLRLAERLDRETRDRLERLRRNRSG